MIHKIHEEVEKIISPVYLVGGAVRDEMMGKEPKDFDFATPFTPDTIEQKIRDAKRKPYLVGKRFGTIGLTFDGQMVEVTTFRSEKYKPDCRKPDVEFVNDIIADLSRRDFTFNACAKRGHRIIDPFNGKEDIDNKLVRCVGIGTTRFKEDPLRMLRACRFAAQLGFTIEEKTIKSALNLNYKILTVSKERWVMEMDKLLLSDNVKLGLTYLMDLGLMKYMIPEMGIQKDYDQKTPYHVYDLWTHTLLTVEGVIPDINLRWAALLHDVGKPFAMRVKTEDQNTYVHHEVIGYEMVLKIGHHLKWSNDRIKVVSELVRDHLNDDSPLKEADKNASIEDQVKRERGETI